MNTAQKIITAIGTVIILYLLFGANVGETKRVLTLKYRDNLVEYICKNEKEYDIIMLKDRHDILFYDGAYFYEEAPSKNVSRVQVVRDVEKLFYGDMSSGDRGWYTFLAIASTLVLLAVASNRIDDDDSYYY